MDMQIHTARKCFAASLSVLSNTVLVLLKCIVGWLSGSVSVIAEGIHSAIDLVASLIALGAVRTSGIPADDRHPFGHGKMESISGAVEALLIFVAAGWIVYEAIMRMIHPAELSNLGLGLAVMGISAVFNQLISTYLLRVGRETDSLALRADAWHLRTDVYTSGGVFIALCIVLIGKRFMPAANLQWVDPVAAMIVATLILKAAWDLASEAFHDLMDSRITDEEESWIRKYVADLVPEVRGFHGLRTRKSGAHRFVEFHLIVDGAMSVKDSHAINDEMERDISARLQGADINIHVEPCDKTCDPVCLSGCFRSESERAAFSGQAG